MQHWEWKIYTICNDLFESHTHAVEWQKEKKVKSLSCAWLFMTPWTVACQAPLPIGFSRQVYQSGLPFPFPMIWIFPTQGSNLGLLHYRQILHQLNHHWSPVKVKVTQSCLTLCNPKDSIVHGFLQARILEWAVFPFSGDLPSPGIKLGSPALQVDSLPTEHQGSPELSLKEDMM